ncbi:MAG: DUF3850 domain-containing protein [Ruminococcaceae bacterium]|nr:DUF3850 domain-containing protein [Oscillospiraceae bacterium]
MVHAVKAYPEYYSALAAGDKTFEVRKNDRPYEVGDILAVNEFIPEEQFEKDMTDFFAPFRRFAAIINNTEPRKAEGGYYTGACKLFTITYILANPQFCKDGMVILGLREFFEEVDDNDSGRV